MKTQVVQFLAFIGAVDTLVVPILFANQEPLFPFPGLYLVEVGLAGLVAGFSLFAQARNSLPWLSAGILLAFVVLGGFSIGFFLVPGFLAFSAGALLLHGRFDNTLLRNLGLTALASVLQVALMLSLIQFI